MNKIKVKLLHCTPESVVNQAIAQPYQSEASFELTKKVIASHKHLSCAEHVVLSFQIDNCSRLELQEHMRHRIASPTVKSTRFALGKMINTDLFVMPNIEKMTFWQKMAFKASRFALNTVSICGIKLCRFLGISNDYLKYLLPESTRTSFVWTINLRSLINFLQLRTAKDAHFEIRHIANLILEEIAKNEQSKYVFELIKEFV